MDTLELAWITVLLLWTQQSAVEEEEGVVSDSSDAAPTLDRAPSGEMRVLLVGRPFPLSYVAAYGLCTAVLCKASCHHHLKDCLQQVCCRAVSAAEDVYRLC